MALTRKLLKGMGLTDEQVDTIIEAHTDTVDGLKADVSKYKTDAEKLPDVQKELDELKAKGDDGWKEKHDKLKGEFDTYKKDVEAKETRGKKVEAYRAALEEDAKKHPDSHLTPNGIAKAIKYANISGFELTEDGSLKDADKHIASAREEWAEYVTTTTTTGAKTSNPPANNGGSGNGKTREEILAIKDGSVRRMEMAKNAHLFPEMPAATN